MPAAPAAAAWCCLLSVVSTLDSVRLVIGRQKCAVAYWKLIGNNMASSGCASSLFLVVVVARCLLLVVVVLHQCCNEQCLHYKAQCVNAMHACACPDTVQTPQTPRQTDSARTHAATHARNEGGVGAGRGGCEYCYISPICWGLIDGFVAALVKCKCSRLLSSVLLFLLLFFLF